MHSWNSIVSTLWGCITHHSVHYVKFSENEVDSCAFERNNCMPDFLTLCADISIWNAPQAISQSVNMLGLICLANLICFKLHCCLHLENRAFLFLLRCRQPITAEDETKQRVAFEIWVRFTDGWTPWLAVCGEYEPQMSAYDCVTCGEAGCYCTATASERGIFTAYKQP